MNESHPGLSPQVLKGRYANFPRNSGGSPNIFMVGYEECSSEYSIDRHDFPFWTLEFIVGGEGYLQARQGLCSLNHGAVFTYGPKMDLSFGSYAERPLKKYFMVNAGREFPKVWSDIGLEPGRLLQLGTGGPAVAILLQILDEGACRDSQTPQIVAGLETVLWGQMKRSKGTARGDRSRSRRVYDLAMDVLQREFRSLHTLGDLAERSGYSGEYLCRLFKKYNTESPYQVLLHRKMSAAWLLLREGQLQVGSVAREMGYEDQLHFSRVFRKLMGCSPSSVQSRS